MVDARIKMAEVSNKASVSVCTSNQYEPKGQASDSSTFKKSFYFVLICMMSQRGDVIRDTMIIQHFHDA